MKHLLIIVSLALFITSCKNNEQQPTEETQAEGESAISLTAAQLENAGITFGKLEQRQISGVIKATGQLDVPPQQLVSVSVPLGGFLKSTVLLEGSKVKRGQVIAVIENPDYIQLQQDYLEARNLAEFNKADYDRQQELAKENVNAQKTLQQSKVTYLNGLARVNGLAERLRLIHIDPAGLKEESITSTANVYSPIDGFVTEVNVNIGKFVNPSDVLFTIVDTEHLHAELTIFEKDIPKIKIGQKVLFTLANETSERMATVYLVGREISQDRTIMIHCHIDKEDKNLLPGMFLSAIVEAGGVIVTALPDEAVVDFENRKYIFIAINGNDQAARNFNMVEIKVGASESGFTEVILPSDFDKNSDIAVTGGYAILSKMKNQEAEHD